MRRRGAAAISLLGLLGFGAPACGDALRQGLRVTVDDDRQVSARAPDDPTARKLVNASYLAFLPAELPMKPGDEAFFSVRSRGEAHTITLGTMVDDAATAIDALGPDAMLAQIEALPEMAALPSVLPSQPSGDVRPEVNGSAAEPCYLESGAPPNSPTGGAPRCDERSRPAFDGRQTFFNSGWLDRDDTFTLSVTDDIKPGTYTMMCLVHRAQMRGTLRVLKAGHSRPSIGAFNDAADARIERLRNEIAAAATHAAFETTARDAVAGYGSPGVSALLTTFGQDTYEIAAGEAVSWSVYGTHTISFDAPDGDLLEKREGRVRLNQEVWRPTGSPPFPTGAQFPLASGAEPIVIDGGSYDGNGRHHSGVLQSAGTPRVTYQLRFPRRGTYQYACLIHPLMTGEVEVR